MPDLLFVAAKFASSSRVSWFDWSDTLTSTHIAFEYVLNAPFDRFVAQYVVNGRPSRPDITKDIAPSARMLKRSNGILSGVGLIGPGQKYGAPISFGSGPPDMDRKCFVSS